MLEIFVDADACPIKPEIYRVAKRYGLCVTLVSNARMRTPQEQWVKLVVVERHLDAADDWIAKHVAADDIVVTADIPLAARCLEKGALVLGNTGVPFNEDNIGEGLATRDLMADLREAGAITGGPPPFHKRDRSRFLQRLDEMIQSVRRRAPSGDGQ
ncbi:MAG: YaiI/YqxD family protein [Proteobacteria bacterium]|nr:YaiI/YqxD family protein [Pseudomonadota bacterium]